LFDNYKIQNSKFSNHFFFFKHRLYHYL